MHKCSKCGEWEAVYDYKEKGYRCKKCGHFEKTVGVISHCMHCGKSYVEFTWFDPSGCPHCYKTFVD